MKITRSIERDLLAIPSGAMDIIGDFDGLLDKIGQERSAKQSYPISQLPYSKEKIFWALRVTLDVVRDEGFRDHLETLLVHLEDFVADDQIPEDEDEVLELWARGKDWTNPKNWEDFEEGFYRSLVKLHGKDADQKYEEIIEEIKAGKIEEWVKAGKPKLS
jgi:hypothetical protein